MARYERVCPEDEAWDKFFEEIGALPIEEARARWDSQPDLLAALTTIVAIAECPDENAEVNIVRIGTAALAKARP